MAVGYRHQNVLAGECRMKVGEWLLWQEEARVPVGKPHVTNDPGWSSTTVGKLPVRISWLLSVGQQHAKPEPEADQATNQVEGH